RRQGANRPRLAQPSTACNHPREARGRTARMTRVRPGWWLPFLALQGGWTVTTYPSRRIREATAMAKTSKARAVGLNHIGLEVGDIEEALGFYGRRRKLRATAPIGRPPTYKPSFPKQAKKVCELGAIDADLADAFAVTTRTIWRWMVQHRDFC